MALVTVKSYTENPDGQAAVELDPIVAVALVMDQRMANGHS